MPKTIADLKAFLDTCPPDAELLINIDCWLMPLADFYVRSDYRCDPYNLATVGKPICVLSTNGGLTEKEEKS